MVKGNAMNNTHDTFSFSGRIRSGTHALHGIIEMLKSQHNAWVHAVATLCVIVAGTVCSVSATQWCLLVLVITTVWVAEGLNTAFEFLCDVASPDFHPLVKKSKDVAAGAVLLSAVGAVSVGLIIFIPYIISYL
jgi:diacylglycerol kinase (ATP)